MNLPDDSLISTRNCKTVMEDGVACKAYSLKISEHCFFHSPEVSILSKQSARSKGGRVKKLAHLEAMELDDIADAQSIKRILSQTISGVASGKISPSVANSIGYLATKSLKVLNQEKKKFNSKNFNFTAYLRGEDPFEEKG